MQVNQRSPATYLNDTRFADHPGAADRQPEGAAAVEDGRRLRHLHLARPPDALHVDRDPAPGHRQEPQNEDLRLQDPAAGRRPQGRDRRHPVLGRQRRHLEAAVHRRRDRGPGRRRRPGAAGAAAAWAGTTARSRRRSRPRRPGSAREPRRRALVARLRAGAAVAGERARRTPSSRAPSPSAAPSSSTSPPRSSSASTSRSRATSAPSASTTRTAPGRRRRRLPPERRRPAARRPPQARPARRQLHRHLPGRLRRRPHRLQRLRLLDRQAGQGAEADGRRADQRLRQRPGHRDRLRPRPRPPVRGDALAVGGLAFLLLAWLPGLALVGGEGDGWSRASRAFSRGACGRRAPRRGARRDQRRRRGRPGGGRGRRRLRLLGA